jgi:CubicO group peptidase (beta-lactamase class C family)
MLSRDRRPRATAALASLPPRHRPGTRVVHFPWEGYSILAEVVRRLDPHHRPFRHLLREEIFTPLGMTDPSTRLVIAVADLSSSPASTVRADWSGR